MNPGSTCENRPLGLSDLELCPKDALAFSGSSGQRESNLMEYIDNPARQQRGDFTPVNSFQS